MRLRQLVIVISAALVASLLPVAAITPAHAANNVDSSTAWISDSGTNSVFKVNTVSGTSEQYFFGTTPNNLPLVPAEVIAATGANGHTFVQLRIAPVGDAFVVGAINQLTGSVSYPFVGDGYGNFTWNGSDYQFKGSNHVIALSPDEQKIAIGAYNSTTNHSAVMFFNLNTFDLLSAIDVELGITDLTFGAVDGSTLFAASSGPDASGTKYNVITKINSIGYFVVNSVENLVLGSDVTCTVVNGTVVPGNLFMDYNIYTNRLAVTCDGASNFVEFDSSLNPVATQSSVSGTNKTGIEYASQTEILVSALDNGASLYSDGVERINASTYIPARTMGVRATHATYSQASHRIFSINEKYLDITSANGDIASFQSTLTVGTNESFLEWIDVVEIAQALPNPVTNVSWDDGDKILEWSPPAYQGSSPITSYDVQLLFADQSQEVISSSTINPTSNQIFPYVELGTFYSSGQLVTASIVATNSNGSSTSTTFKFWMGEDVTNISPHALSRSSNWRVDGVGNSISSIVTDTAQVSLNEAQAVWYLTESGDEIPIPCLDRLSSDDANHRLGKQAICAPVLIDGYQFTLKRFFSASSPWLRVAVDVKNISSTRESFNLAITSGTGYPSQPQIVASGELGIGSGFSPEERRWVAFGDGGAGNPIILNILDPNYAGIPSPVGDGTDATRQIPFGYTLAVPVGETQTVSETLGVFAYNVMASSDSLNSYAKTIERVQVVANSFLNGAGQRAEFNSVNPTNAFPITEVLNIPDVIRSKFDGPVALSEVEVGEADALLRLDFSFPFDFNAPNPIAMEGACGANFGLQAQIPEDPSLHTVIGSSHCLNYVLDNFYVYPNSEFPTVTFNLSTEAEVVISDTANILDNTHPAFGEMDVDIDYAGTYWDAISNSIGDATTPNNSDAFDGFGEVRLGNSLGNAEPISCNRQETPRLSSGALSKTIECADYQPVNFPVSTRMTRSFARQPGWVMTTVTLSSDVGGVVPVWFGGELGSDERTSLEYSNTTGNKPSRLSLADNFIVTSDDGANDDPFIINAWQYAPVRLQTLAGGPVVNGAGDLWGKWLVEVPANGQQVTISWLTAVIDIPDELPATRQQIRSQLIPEVASTMPDRSNWTQRETLRNLPIIWPHVSQPPSGSVNAVLSDDGTEAFIRGEYAEAGINANGYFGTQQYAPDSFHPSYSGGGEGPNGYSNDALGFVSDRERDGWGVGYDDGDYFLPGTPYEAFALSIAGQEFHNSNSGSAIQRDSVVVTPSDTAPSSTWTSTPVADSLVLTQTTSIPVSQQRLDVSVTIQNTSTQAVNEIIYGRHVDPDNNVEQGCNYDTTNQVDAQIATDGIAVVSARRADDCRNNYDPTRQSEGSYLGLISRDPRAIVGYETNGFDPRRANYFFPSENEFVVNTPGQPSFTDSGIGVSFEIGSLEPGASTTIQFSYILSPDEIDNVIDEVVDSVLAPAISASATSVNLQKGIALLESPVVFANSGGPWSYCSAATPLPAGLTLDPAECTFSGTPSAEGVTEVVISANNIGGSSSATITFSVSESIPQFTLSSDVFNLRSGVAVTQPPFTVISVGGAAATEYALTPSSPALPDGLLLDTATGLISGTPSTTSLATAYSIVGRNAAGESQPVTFVMSVWETAAEAPTAIIAAPTLRLAVGEEVSELPVSLANVSAVPTFSISPSLPTGLALDSGSGLITGIPLSGGHSALYTLTASVGGYEVNSRFRIVIEGAPLQRPNISLSRASMDLFIGQDVLLGDNFEVTNSGGGITRYTVFPELPAGLSLDPLTGVISGRLVSDELDNEDYILFANNEAGSDSAAFIITASANPPIIGLSSRDVTLAQGVTFDRSYLDIVSEGGPAIVWTITPSLPAGLNFDSGTGQISGKPAIADPGVGRLYTIRATGLAGTSDTATFIMRVTKAHSAPKAPATLKMKKSATVSALSSGKQILTVTSLTKKICTVSAVKKSGKISSYTLKGVKAGNCQIMFTFNGTTTWNAVNTKSAMIKVTK